MIVGSGTGSARYIWVKGADSLVNVMPEVMYNILNTVYFFRRTNSSIILYIILCTLVYSTKITKYVDISFLRLSGRALGLVKNKCFLKII